MPEPRQTMEFSSFEYARDEGNIQTGNHIASSRALRVE